MKKKMLVSMLALFLMVVSSCLLVQAISWPSISSGKPIRVYTISTGNHTTAYTNANLTTKVGTIYASDELYITGIGVNSRGVRYCSLTYPTSRGRKKGYVPLSVITKVSSPGNKYTARATITSYRRANSGTKAGSVYKGDIVYKLTASGSYTQILYNIGSASKPVGWRMAWITTDNFNRYVGTGYNPMGCIDNVYSNSNKKLTVRGWAFDKDKVSENLSIHVYVGGPSGSGAPGYAITANKYRPDVNNVHKGSGNYHGFESTISVSRTGNQTIYFYAINVGHGSNVFLGSRNVNIKGSTASSGSGNLASPVPSGAKFNRKTNDGGWYGYHDINRGVKIGTPVYAIADGTITCMQAYRGYGSNAYLTSYGNYIELKTASGYTAKYCHLNKFNGINQIISSSRTKDISGRDGTHILATKYVKKGAVIGYIGTTGHSSGAHLHFELRKNGVRIDPTAVIKGLV